MAKPKGDARAAVEYYSRQEGAAKDGDIESIIARVCGLTATSLLALHPELRATPRASGARALSTGEWIKWRRALQQAVAIRWGMKFESFRHLLNGAWFPRVDHRNAKLRRDVRTYARA